MKINHKVFRKAAEAFAEAPDYIHGACHAIEYVVKERNRWDGAYSFRSKEHEAFTWLMHPTVSEANEYEIYTWQSFWLGNVDKNLRIFALLFAAEFFKNTTYKKPNERKENPQ